ncbi:MAG: hypothetical protein AB8B93_18340 [Pseudomonadales bacterium]
MYMTSSFTAAAILGGALLYSAAVLADEAEQAFSEMDADRNGMLDRAEAQASPNLQVYFGRADTDADGAITLSEYQIFAADFARAQEDVPAE